MKVLNYSLLFMFIMLVVSCSKSEQTPEQDPPEIIDINNLIDPSIDPESGGDILDIDYYIDLNEDGITDYILDGIHASSHNGTFHNVVLFTEHDNSYVIKDRSFEIEYNSIDTVITYDTIQPYIRTDITKTKSCRPIESPNVTIDTIDQGNWLWEPEFEEPDADDSRWLSQSGFLLFKAFPTCEPPTDFGQYLDEFTQTCFKVIHDCHGLFEVEQAYFYLKVVTDGKVTLGYLKSEQSPDGSHAFKKLVRLKD